MTKRHAYTVLSVLMVLCAVQHVWYWPQLPERVATHFGADGQPNDWMSRTASTTFLVAMQLGVPLFMIGITALAAKLPSSMVNIPNREYWLHADRREATLEHMSAMMAWMSVFTSLFMAAIAHLTFEANRNANGLNMGKFLTALVCFLLAVFTMAFRSMRRFRMPR